MLLGGFVPADKGISGLNRPGGGSPADTGHRAIPQEGHILKMLTDNLAVTEIMILMNEAVVERFQGGVPDHAHSDGIIIAKRSRNWALIHKDGE